MIPADYRRVPVDCRTDQEDYRRDYRKDLVGNDFASSWDYCRDCRRDRVGCVFLSEMETPSPCPPPPQHRNRHTCCCASSSSCAKRQPKNNMRNPWSINGGSHNMPRLVLEPRTMLLVVAHTRQDKNHSTNSLVTLCLMLELSGC